MAKYKLMNKLINYFKIMDNIIDIIGSEVSTKYFLSNGRAFESSPDNVSDVIFLTITSNKIPVFLNLECFTYINVVFL